MQPDAAPPALRSPESGHSTEPTGSAAPARSTGTPAPDAEHRPGQTGTQTHPVVPSSPLALAALASVAVPGLDPVRLARPQTLTTTLRVAGVIDTKGRHWEILQARTDAAGASLDAETEVLRRLGRQRDDGHLSFDVPRPAGSLRQEGSHIQVRSHIEGNPINLASLRPGPGLSASLGQALGELHDLPTTVVSEAGLPVYDAEEVRQRWLTLLDDAAATGKVPPSLLARWEEMLEDTALWRFRPTVVHGDLAEENIVTAGGGVVALRGLTSMHVGDPAEDLAWLYATAPVDCLDSIEGAYERSRREGVDAHARDRAELVSEMSLVRWLMHGVRSQDQDVIDDAVAMLTDLLAQVGGDEDPSEAATEVLDAAELRAEGLDEPTGADGADLSPVEAPSPTQEPSLGPAAEEAEARAAHARNQGERASAEAPLPQGEQAPADTPGASGTEELPAATDAGKAQDRPSDAVEPHDAQTQPIPTDTDPTRSGAAPDPH